MSLREKLRNRWQLVTVTVVALVLAIGVGPTVASHLKVRSNDIVNGQVKTPDLHKSAVTSKKLHDGAVVGRNIRDHGVGRVDLGNQVVAARAYAYVNADGTVDSSRSKNLTSANVDHASTGVYCLDVPFDIRHIMVSSAYGVAAGYLSTLPLPSCSGTFLAVYTKNYEGGHRDGSFWMTLY